MVATKSCEILLGDPSHITQSFPQFQVQLLCCRYWWLKEWENPHQALPFWRIYHNTTSGGMISYNNQTFELSPKKIYLIPPETDYATYIKGHNIKNDKRVISGDLLSNLSDEQQRQIFEKGAIGHLFIHFIILRPFIQVPLEVFEFDYDGEMKRKFEQIFAYLKEENSTFDLSISTIIYSLICILLSKISLRSREQQIANRRLTKMFYYINEHLEQSLTNDVFSTDNVYYT